MAQATFMQIFYLRGLGQSLIHTVIIIFFNFLLFIIMWYDSIFECTMCNI